VGCGAWGAARGVRRVGVRRVGVRRSGRLYPTALRTASRRDVRLSE